MDEKNHIQADKTLIESLGGPTRLAEQLGFDKAKGGVQRVQNWMTRGIPPKEKLARPDIFLQDLSPAQQRRATDAAPAAGHAGRQPPTTNNMLDTVPEKRMSTTPTPDLVNEALRAILTEVVLTNKTADKAELILLAQTAAAAFKAGLAAFEGVAAPTVVYDPVTSSMVPAVEQGAGPTSAEDFEVAVSVTRPLSERPAHDPIVSAHRLGFG
eukprot:gene41746-51735_t